MDFPIFHIDFIFIAAVNEAEKQDKLLNKEKRNQITTAGAEELNCIAQLVIIRAYPRQGHP